MHRLALMLIAASLLAAPPPTPAAKTDPLGRDNPRSAVTGFLEACQEQNYPRASQYLDLQHLTPQNRTRMGPTLAKGLEAILNSDPEFGVFRLSRNSDGDPSNDPEPDHQHVTTIKHNSQTFTLDLERVTPPGGGPSVWLFAPDAVLAIPRLTPSSAPPAIAKYLPPFMQSVHMLETPLWKWLALLLAALFLITLGRLLDRAMYAAIHFVARRLGKEVDQPVAVILNAPLRVILTLALFRMVVQVVDPSAIARLYIGRGLQLVLVWAIAWFLIKLTGLFVGHIESVLDHRQRYASRSMLHLGRRTASVTIVVLAILTLFSSWGYNMSTFIAGLGVGGIAVALAAQQTIANVFGGVSVIGDEPVRIGDLGKFGDLVGVVEDIGMRSTRIRTMARTVVSVPNSAFAGLNIENYTLRDKMLFNPTIQIKRTTPKEQTEQAMQAVLDTLARQPDLETGSIAVRLTALTSAALNLEIFCYVKTSELNHFYEVQSRLFLAINEALKSANIELA